MADPANSPDGKVPAARVGTVVKGKWHIDALLGVGGMAAVYAATHRNGQHAALKILHIDFARERQVTERFLREAYVSNKIGHPACVQVLDDDVTDEGEPFLVMELLEGETLRDFWKRTGRRVPVVQVLQIAERILDCLVACHAKGVIHRDLKPANIFITHEGEVKVLDFGVAQMRDAAGERTATGTALGTPAYMSPEQAMGLVDQLDGRADLFSVGAMVHALSTGKRINHGRTENEALIMAATTPVPSVARLAPDLPVEVITLIDKSLAWDRRNRYSDARDMQSAVVGILATLGAAPLGAHTPIVANPLVPPPAAAAAPAPAPLAAPAAAAFAPPVSPAPPVVARAPAAAGVAEAQVAENDPRVQQLRDLFKQIDRLLPSVRQFGWEHPATERALRTAFEAFVEALASDPRLVRATVRPYSFQFGGQTIWEPGPPFDAIPYNLFACGVRTLTVKSTITLDEMRSLLTLVMLDPSRDLPPEDDIAAALWERAFAHVEYEVADAFAEGDAAEREAFYSESDHVEEQAANASRAHVSRIEARAMAVSTDKSALRGPAREPSPMSLEDVVRAVYSTQLDMPRDRWTERYVDVLVEGYIDAAFSRDAALVLASIRKSAADLIVAKRLDLVLGLHAAVHERLSQRVGGTDLVKLAAAMTNAMFGAEALELALGHLKSAPDQVPAFEPVLSQLAVRELPTVLAALRGSPPEPVRRALLAYVERALPGREMEVAATATGLDADGAAAILAMLGRVGTPAAREALGVLAQSEDVNLRVEAKMMAAPPDQAHVELTSMLDNGSALVRMAALRAIARHSLKQAFPTVARYVKAPAFHDLGTDERRELLRTLLQLSPEHAEPILIDILKKGGVFTSSSREGSRTVAAEILGELSTTSTAADALREVSQTRWGTSDETRNAASNAATQISVRTSGRAPAAGAAS